MPVITERSESAIRARLRAYVEEKPLPKRAKKEWKRPGVDEFAEGSVLAFDQTFAKTGWCILTVYDGFLHIVAKGVLKEPPSQFRGFEDTLMRALWMSDRITTVVVEYVMRQSSMVPQPPVIVHEMPAVKGYRPESSLLAALAVRQAAARHDLGVFMQSNSHMRTVMTPPGSDRQSKVPLREAANHYLDTSKGWNQDERDALLLGLTHLYDRKRAMG